MPQATVTLSQRYIADLDDRRDLLWGMAFGVLGASAVSPGKADAFLQGAIREGFAAVEKDPATDAWTALEGILKGRGASADISHEAGAMPADIWARLVATVQVEASRSAHSRAINPDSVLLSPDPLLAPRRVVVADDADGFDLSPSSRFVIAGGVAVLVGIGVTVYLLTRGGGSESANRRIGQTPTSTTATSLPGAAKAIGP